MKLSYSLNFLNNKRNIFFLLLCSYPWLLISGPFLSDGIAIILSIYYLINKLSNKEFDDFKTTPFIIFCLFCLYIFLNSLFIGKNLVSIKSSIFFFRFGLFAFAISFLLNENKERLRYFFFSFIVVLSLLFFDSIFQKIFEFNILGMQMSHSIRVSSFFGEELVLGSYIIKILPIVLAFLYFIFHNEVKIYSIILIFISLIIILLSAEKAALMMMILFSILFFLVLNYSFKIKSLVLLLFFTLLSLIVILNKPIQDRLYHQFISNTGGGKYIYSKMHDSHFRTAYKMFLDKPILGHGPKMYRYKCSNEKYNFDKYSCSTHPHNFVLQILSETGLVGLTFLILFYLSLLKIFLNNAIKFKLKKNFHYTEYILSSSLLVIFFPLGTSGNIFNNWTSCIHFLTIGILLFFLKMNKNKQISNNNN